MRRREIEGQVRTRRILWDALDMNNFYFLFFWTMKRHVTSKSHDRLHDVMS